MCFIFILNMMLNYTATTTDYDDIGSYDWALIMIETIPSNPAIHWIFWVRAEKKLD